MIATRRFISFKSTHYQKSPIALVISFILLLALTAPQTYAQSKPEIGPNPDIAQLKTYINFLRTPAEQYNTALEYENAFNDLTPIQTRVEVDIIKLHALSYASNIAQAGDFAKSLEHKYKTNDYTSDQFAYMMYEMSYAYARALRIEDVFNILDIQRRYIKETPSGAIERNIDHTLTDIYIASRQYDRALTSLKQILKNPDYQDLDIYKNYEHAIINNIAHCYTKLNKPRQALVYLVRARESIEEHLAPGSDKIAAFAINKVNNGRAISLTDDFDQLQELGLEIKNLGAEIQHLYIEAVGYRLSANAAYKLKNYETALIHLENMLAIAEKYNLSNLLPEAYKDHAHILTALGREEEALNAQEKHLKTLDTIEHKVDTIRLQVVTAETNMRKQQRQEARAAANIKKQQALAHRETQKQKMLIISAALAFALLSCLMFIGFKMYKKANFTTRLL